MFLLEYLEQAFQTVAGIFYSEIFNKYLKTYNVFYEFL